MTNQYIVQFKSNTDDKFTYGYAELFKSNYDIPVLSVRTLENKTDPMNRTLFHQYITNNFGVVNYSDENMECILSCLNNDYVIKFDKNSSSAFTGFKNYLSTLLNSKFETEYYPSGNVLYVGLVLHIKENDVVVKRQPHGHGVLYYDLPNHKIKYSGEFENGVPDGAGVFYDRSGKIKLVANNISNGIPTQKGKLELDYKLNKQTVNIDFFTVWNDLNVYNNTEKVSLVISDNFLDTLVENVCEFNDVSYEEICFNEKSLDDKLVEVWNQLDTLQMNYDEHYEYVKKSIEISHNILFGLGAGLLLNMLISMVF